MHRFLTACLIAVTVCTAVAPCNFSWAQQPASDAAATGSGPEAGISQAELQRLAAEAQNSVAAVEAPNPDRMSQGSINFLSLLIEGGALMIPIGIMSLLVVAVTLERAIALRTGKLFPRKLRREIRRSIEDTSAADPQALFTSVDRQPSVAARVLQDVLQKVGRPIPEIESAISEGVQREADRLYGNVRWLTLAAAVTPLIGLLGTVWGMIIAFYNTTQLGAGMNKAEFLAEGIYVALVTTLGGLAVAIPAAIVAHYFEGKITKTLSRVEHELRALVPRFELLEGRGRYDISSRGLTRRVLPDASVARTTGEHGFATPAPSPKGPTPPPQVRSSAARG